MSAATKGECVDGMECVYCGKSWNRIMDRPAVKQVGWNPTSGVLYDCSACHSRFTQAQFETGLELSELIRNDFEGFEPTSYSEYRSENDTTGEEP